MVQIGIEKLCSIETVCGIWANQSFVPVERLLCSLIKSVFQIRCVAFCGIGETSFDIYRVVQRLKTKYPFLRIAIIGNTFWYERMPCSIQDKLLHLLDAADFFIPCPYPIDDALTFLSYCSDFLIVENCKPFFDYTKIIDSKKNIKIYKL